MKKIITIAIIIIFVIALLFIKINYKKLNFGNNKSKTANQIAEYILDIKSYKANATITIKSNKNTNKYKIVEKYSKDNNLFFKQIQEPQNLNGMIFTYDGTNLKIENSRLDLKKIYENYPYVGEEETTLISFIDSYKKAKESKVEEINDEIVMSMTLENTIKKLYINKDTSKPIKMEIKNVSQKSVIYILYNEIEINNLR